MRPAVFVEALALMCCGAGRWYIGQQQDTQPHLYQVFGLDSTHPRQFSRPAEVVNWYSSNVFHEAGSGLLKDLEDLGHYSETNGINTVLRSSRFDNLVKTLDQNTSLSPDD